MTFFNYKCEECGRGIVKDTKKKNYKVEIFNQDFRITEAIIGICNNCGSVNYAGEEIKRWRKLYRKWQTKSKKYLSPDKVKEIRRSLDMTQKDFAEFIGVTRQSISTWEKTDRPSVQPKNVDIVFRLLYQELDSRIKPVTKKMYAIYKDSNDENKFEIQSKNDILKSILPETTWGILKNNAKNNDTSPLIEIIRIIELLNAVDDYGFKITKNGRSLFRENTKKYNSKNEES
ncbi:MAG: type II toxin-antitoxin system MqsA family antitoxin [Candidatus Marinimicrobia bacterium]|nr:type II toxin-antitoxin system MqsA family antitoxin [Candidatus Neomarinimicrobiota bacterium]